MALNLKKLMFAALPLLLPACAQDEPGEGRMPMEFTVSLADESPQSRVSESDDGSKSVWTEGDQITVNVTQGGSTQTATSQTATCTLGSDGNVKEYSKTLYWESRESATVSASYSNLGANNSIADQSRGLAYVLRADASTTYGNTIGLTFRHQFAKVRIKFEGSKASEVTDVKINNYTQCTVATDGKVTGSSGTEGYIITRKNGDYYEANVCPVTSLPDNFIDAGEDFKVSVTGISKLEAGKVYTITINAKEPPQPEITVNGHTAYMMRKPTATEPALYFATTNIGADNPEDPGLYFWWGDTQGHALLDSPITVGTEKRYTDFNFSTDNTDIITFLKSSGGADGNLSDLKRAGIITEGKGWSSDKAPVDNLSRLTDNYDAAKQQWADDWRMPTADEIYWLLNNCEWDWQTNYNESGVAGYIVTSEATNKSIFLPLAGYFSGYYFNKNYSYYRTSSPSDHSTNSSISLEITKTKHRTYDIHRYCGYYIRPVINQ